MENYPCKQQTEQGGGEQGMAALFSISKLELLEESAGTKASWMLLVRAWNQHAVKPPTTGHFPQQDGWALEE